MITDADRDEFRTTVYRIAGNPHIAPEQRSPAMWRAFKRRLWHLTRAELSILAKEEQAAQAVLLALQKIGLS